MSDLSYHQYVTNNRIILEAGDTCKCIYCLKPINKTEIIDWCDNSQTAICPHCGVDAIISDTVKYTMEDITKWRAEGWDLPAE